MVDTFILDQNNLPTPPEILPSIEVIARGATWNYFESIDTSTAANGTAPNKYSQDSSLRDWFDLYFNKTATDCGI